MTEKGQDVRLPVEIVGDLVAGHVHALWSQVVNDEDMRGCCKKCCAPCNALAQLHDLGMLDELYEVYHLNSGGGESDVWDSKNRQLDRSWFDGAWRDDMGCHEEADEDA